MKQMKTVFLSMVLLAPGAVFAGQSADEMAERLREAERRMEEAARELADINLQMHGGELEQVFRFVHGNDPDRAMLGINIGRIEIHGQGEAAGPGDAPDGVAVLGVTPGGPAAGAGLQAGDVILALNGDGLAGHGEPPERRLQQLMDEVDPGEAVSVRYRRGDAEQTTEIVTQAFDVRAFGAGADVDIEVFGPGEAGKWVERMPFLPALMQRRAWRGLELVELNADLGRYFGTDEGLLVVRAPIDQSLALQAGDVVQTIGGASPGSVPDAMRLLRFYQPGDKVVIEVMRDKRGKALEVVMPSGSAEAP